MFSIVTLIEEYNNIFFGMYAFIISFIIKKNLTTRYNKLLHFGQNCKKFFLKGNFNDAVARKRFIGIASCLRK